MADSRRDRAPNRAGDQHPGQQRQQRAGAHGPQAHDQAQEHEGVLAYGNALVQDLLKQGHQELDDLVDLSPSQARWIRVLRELEMLNPPATVQDLAMAVSLRIWNAGQMWDDNGKSSYPGLILDYEGGDGHKSVRFGDGQGSEISRRDLMPWAKDQGGDASNVNHAFPAVAAQAGRGTLSAEYASFMATSGGDTLQNRRDADRGREQLQRRRVHGQPAGRGHRRPGPRRGRLALRRDAAAVPQGEPRPLKGARPRVGPPGDLLGET